MWIKTDKSLRGRLYLLKVYLYDNDIVYKIGITSKERCSERMMEVLRDFHSKFRYVPKTVILRDRELSNPRKKEKELHEKFKENNVIFNDKFGGSTEFFADIDEDILLDEFNNL